MAKFKVIHVDIYKRDITVFIGSHNEFKIWISQYDATDSWKELVENVLQSNDDAEASYWYNNNNGNGIIELSKHPESKEDIATAAHECLHCVMRILSYVGIPCVEYEANEAYTYLLEYLLLNILDYNDYEFINV